MVLAWAEVSGAQAGAGSGLAIAALAVKEGLEAFEDHAQIPACLVMLSPWVTTTGRRGNASSCCAPAAGLRRWRSRGPRGWIRWRPECRGRTVIPRASTWLTSPKTTATRLLTRPTNRLPSAQALGDACRRALEGGRPQEHPGRLRAQILGARQRQLRTQGPSLVRVRFQSAR